MYLRQTIVLFIDAVAGGGSGRSGSARSQNVCVFFPLFFHILIDRAHLRLIIKCNTRNIYLKIIIPKGRRRRGETSDRIALYARTFTGTRRILFY